MNKIQEDYFYIPFTILYWRAKKYTKHIIYTGTTKPLKMHHMKGSDYGHDHCDCDSDIL